MSTFVFLRETARAWADDMNARALAEDDARAARLAALSAALDAVMAGDAPPGELERVEAAWQAEQAHAVERGNAFFGEGYVIGVVLAGAYRAALGHALDALHRGAHR